MKERKMKLYEPKLTPEELIDSPTFKGFVESMDDILENLEDVDFTARDDDEDEDDDDEVPQELLLGRDQLSELSSESAKIKAMGITDRAGDAGDEDRRALDDLVERVTNSADACLTALHVMTSRLMPKAVYIEDVIERVLQYTRFHLQATVYPHYDRTYTEEPRGGSTPNQKVKRPKCPSQRQKAVGVVYNKLCDVVSNISELLSIQLLTDSTVLQVTSMGMTPFFVENVSELQLCSIRLVTAVFARYKKHRQLILEEVFTSLARLPTSKRSLRHYRINSGSVDKEPQYIQMVSALVLQLIQCVVVLPSERHVENVQGKEVDQDVLITSSYETSMRTAQNFLLVFLKKCGSKQGEEDYRPLFENFVQDLLMTVNKPEWPAAELLLSLLGRLLVYQFSTKQTEMALRVASLDYLGTVAAHLRKDTIENTVDKEAVNHILKEIPGREETQRLQKALLSYLEDSGERDWTLAWFWDTATETEKAAKLLKNAELPSGRRHTSDADRASDVARRSEKRKKFLRKAAKTLLSQNMTPSINPYTVDYEDACLIVRYLASMRPFAKSFNVYLTQILRVLGESAIAVRTKAMKCLSEVVAVDPSILSRAAMRRGVHGRLMDSSTSVREAAVELVGHFVLSRPHLTEQYYDMLVERILDTGISVRKRVIKILRDICLEQPGFHKITDTCVRMIRRVNDEDGIKKLVNETFQKMWFTPTPSHDKEAITRKILVITDVVLACKDSGYDWFEQLLQNLLKSEENASYKPATKACIQLVDNLVKHILTLEEAYEDCESREDHLISSLTTLYLFSKTRAQLLVKHAVAMQPYLATRCNRENDYMVVCNVAKILELVVPLMEEPSQDLLITIEEDLMRLIIKHGVTVVQHCVSCLGVVVNQVTHNYMFVWACFNRYYGVLIRLKVQHQEDPDDLAMVAHRAALLRSLLTVGTLCRHFDFDRDHFKGGHNKIVIKDRVLDLLLYFTAHREEEVQAKAIMALGALFIMHPALMFLQEVRALYTDILSDKSGPAALKVQVLKNLQSYLQEEDSRMLEADRDWQKLSKQEDLKEMGDISSGMSSSIMQLYLKQVLDAFFHTEASVRHFALSGAVLTLSQGLVHPVQCVPYLIAMGTDPDPSMRNKADQQLADIDKKYSGFIHMKAVSGMKMAYQLQQAIAGPEATVVRGFREDDTNSALCSHLFSMVRTNRQHRRALLISLLNQFDDSAKTEVNLLLFMADNLAYFPYQTQEEPLFIMHHVDVTLSVSGSNLLQSFKESLRKNPARKKKMRKTPPQGKKPCSGAEENDERDNARSNPCDEDDEEAVSRPKESSPQPPESESDSDSDLEDVDEVMERLPDRPGPLLEFSSASQGVLLLLVLKQHLKTLYGFSDGKIQKYSPTDPAKVYDKAVNRKSNVRFDPRQTLDFLNTGLVGSDLSCQFKLLMEHLDRDEEDEERRSKTAAGDAAATPVELMDMVAVRCPGNKERPQIARVMQKTTNGGYTVHWMSGSYAGPWAESRRRDGGKLVPRTGTVQESDIIYRKISLTSGRKLTSRVAQTLRELYATN
ncbi:Nipped-B-like protein [Merluccius polli]|uniref:Nipped-B protein n=1 Tax=Merluccius polli TaxID=89951 RepID=A0AA47MG53_MERPO|nr:Nipped-B-like protein [Merluccius polli]KAK0152514.1 Nipped-B-like protein [Merluccius polli]